MLSAEPLIELVAVVVLGAFLHHRWRRRWRARPSQEDPCVWTGTSLEVVNLKPRIDTLRRKHRDHRPSPTTHRHRQLIGLARQAVCRLAFFHDREPAAGPRA